MNAKGLPDSGGAGGGRRRAVRRLVACCILLLCVAAGTSIALRWERWPLLPPATEPRVAGEPVRPPSAGPARSRQQLLRELDAALDRTAASIDPADIDVAARARRLGAAGPIFKWVAETIRYEHYDGVLRGALGTMVAGAGNSCDKAMLLAEMLGAAGERVTVKVGVADHALNDRLVNLALRSTAGVSAAAARGPEAYLLSRASIEVRAIAAAMPVFAAALEQASPASVVASFCWVEDERGGVLDPTLQSPIAAAPDDASDALQRQRFMVRFSVVLETSEAGVLKDELVHASTFTADALGYVPVTLTIAPAGDLTATLKTSADPWGDLAKIDAFYPVIAVGDRQEMTKGFSLDGTVVALNAPAPLQGVDSLGGGIGAMLGGGRGGEVRAPGAGARGVAVSAAFAGVRLDIEVTGPGVRQRISREIVRGAALRAETRPGAVALRVVQQRQFLAPTFAVSRPYGAHLLIEHFRRNRPVLEALASADPPRELPPVHSYPLRLLTLAARQDQGAALIGWRHSGALFRARPAILAERSTFDVDSALVARRVTIDIVDTGFGAMSRSPSGRLLRALLGAQSTLLEAELFAGEGGTGTIQILRRAAAKKIDLVAIGSENDSTFARLSISAPERAGLIPDLRAGYAVLTVPQPVSAAFPRYAWWRVDRNTGEVLGVLPTGEGGQTATETFMKNAAAGAIVGATFTYLNCYFLQGQGGYRCLFSAACGAVIGGLSAGVGGIFGDASFRLILVGNAAGGAVGFPGEFCEVPPHDSNDNDGRWHAERSGPR